MSAEQFESVRQLLLVLEEYSLYFVDHSKLVEAGLLDVKTLMPTTKAHAFVDNTHNAERWIRAKSNANSLHEAMLLADQYAREDLGLL